MIVRVGPSPIDPASLCRAVFSRKFGAVASFTGTVRSPHAGRHVKAVTYDCFTPLAIKELSRIAAAAERRWPVRVAVSHRTGRLAVGAASVSIAVGSSHRAEAFEACRYVIDELKKTVPIWKKEHYTTGSGRWLAGCALQGHRS